LNSNRKKKGISGGREKRCVLGKHRGRRVMTNKEAVKLFAKRAVEWSRGGSRKYVMGGI